VEYLLLVCEDPNADPYDPALDNIEEWVASTDGMGTRRQGDRLAKADAARTVRVRGGQVSVTEGPFAELGELIAGYDLLECDSLEQAVEIAAQHPMARFGQIEVRPIWTLGLSS